MSQILLDSPIGDNLGANINANFTEVYLASAAAQGAAVDAQADATAALSAGRPFDLTVPLTAANSAAGITVVSPAQVAATEKVYVTGFLLNVSGATAWSDITATVVVLKDTHATLPATGITFAKAGLTGNRVIDSLDTTNVTAAAPILAGSGFTAGEGLVLIADALFAAGSTINFTCYGYIK